MLSDLQLIYNYWMKVVTLFLVIQDYNYVLKQNVKLFKVAIMYLQHLMAGKVVMCNLHVEVVVNRILKYVDLVKILFDFIFLRLFL